MPTVIHVGFQKTASTALQGSVFPRLDDCYFFNRHPDFFAFVRNVEGRPDSGEYVEDKWRGLLRDAATRSHTLLISREDFSSRRRWPLTAERLHALAPGARILVCVRDQRTMLPSMYSQHLKGGGCSSFPAWLDQFDFEWLEYDRLVGRYQQLFGPDAVKVMAFEHLRTDPDGFVDAVCGYVTPGRPAVTGARLLTKNRGLAPPSRWVFRHANRLFRTSKNNPSPPLPADIVWRGLESTLHRLDPRLFAGMSRLGTARDQERVEELLPRFAASNARLEAMAGIDLHGYGYPTS